MNTSTKLCVYAICKNESKFIDRWVGALQGEADCVVVLDTGSTDDSVEKLKKYEPFVTVKQFNYLTKFDRFEFNRARNDSLKLVPFDVDVCVVMDLDHVPRKGWANVIKQHYEEGYTEILGLIVDHDENGNEINSWTSRNAHSNSPYWIWEKVIHEGIRYCGEDKVKTIKDERFVLDHFPDFNKDRSLYKSLLYYQCKDNPKDPYYGIWNGIELHRRGYIKESCEAFRRALRECDYTNQNDIHYQTYLNLALVTDDTDEALEALAKAKELEKITGIRSRRYYRNLANIYERLGQPDKAVQALEEAIATIPSYSSDWTDDEGNYDGSMEDRLSLFYYYDLHNLSKAIEWCSKAIELNPDNNRLRINMRFFVEAALKQQKGLN